MTDQWQGGMSTAFIEAANEPKSTENKKPQLILEKNAQFNTEVARGVLVNLSTECCIFHYFAVPYYSL